MAPRWVTKKSGSLEKFSKAKIIRGIRKSKSSMKHAEWVARRIAAKSYDKISTRKIGQMVVANLRKVDRKAATSFGKVFDRNWRGL